MPGLPRYAVSAKMRLIPSGAASQAVHTVKTYAAARFDFAPRVETVKTYAAARFDFAPRVETVKAYIAAKAI